MEARGKRQGLMIGVLTAAVCVPPVYAVQKAADPGALSSGVEASAEEQPNARLEVPELKVDGVSDADMAAAGATREAPLYAQANPGDGAAGAAAAPPPASQPPVPSRFLGRLLKAYWDDFNGAPLPGDNTSTRRGYPAPVNSPPYPWSDWPYGGSYTIGTPDVTDGYPLTHALYGSNTAFTDWMKDNRIRIWGFAEVGGNASSSHVGANSQNKGVPGFPTAGTNYANAPAAYAAIPNTVQLDQATLYINR